MKLNRPIIIGSIGGILLLILGYSMFSGNTDETNTSNRDSSDHLMYNGKAAPLFGGIKKRNTKKKRQNIKNRTVNKK
jgi:hypothetical protein